MVFRYLRWYARAVLRRFVWGWPVAFYALFLLLAPWSWQAWGWKGWTPESVAVFVLVMNWVVLGVLWWVRHVERRYEDEDDSRGN